MKTKIFFLLTFLLLTLNCASDTEPEPTIVQPKNNFKTNLVYACDQGDLESVKYLVGNGADVNAIDTTNQEQKIAQKMFFLEGYTPLTMAVVKNHGEIIKFLIEKGGSNINGKTDIGETPLHIANIHDNIEMIKYLVEKGANLNEKDKYSMTPLFKFVGRNQPKIEIIKYLVEKGANVKAVTDGGSTVLMSAAPYGNLEVIKYLLSKGVNINAKDTTGKTAIDYAEKMPEIVNFLKSYKK